MGTVHMPVVCHLGFVFFPTNFAYIGPETTRGSVLLMDADNVCPQCSPGREGLFTLVALLLRPSWMS